MKLIQSLLIFAFVLLSTNTISAQYGNVAMEMVMAEMVTGVDRRNE